MAKIKENPKENDDNHDVSDSLRIFETRWRYAVFPAMVLFVLLIGFMFYLIYGMLQRMEDLSKDIHNMSNVISEALPVMQGGVVGMSSRMQWVGEDMSKMSKNMSEMSKAITKSMPKLEKGVTEMSSNIGDMTVATTSMAMTTHSMGENLWDMNRNVSKPFSAMNKMIPWSGNNDRPPRPMMPPIYNTGPSSRMPMYGGIPATPPAGASIPVATYPNLQPTPEVVAKEPSVQEVSGKSKYHGYCASCHGIDGKGGVGPSVIGKPAKYITQVLNEYRNGKRTGTMVGVVEVLSKEDIKNVSVFLASGHLQ